MEPSRRRALESFTFEIDDPDTDDFLPTLQQLWELGQRDASFFHSMTSIRHADFNVVCLLYGFKTWMLQEKLESQTTLPFRRHLFVFFSLLPLNVMIELTTSFLDLSTGATYRLCSIPWKLLTNLTSLQVELVLGVEQGTTPLAWNTRAPNNFALSFSDLPHLQSLKIHINCDCEMSFTSRAVLSSAMDHVWRDSVDGCFAPPRFYGLKKLEIEVTIAVSGLETGVF